MIDSCPFCLMMEKLRLQKYFTDMGIMSRRRAEAEISAGRVKVNGNTVPLGFKIDPKADVVEWNGKVIEYRQKDASSFTYIKLYKPLGYVTTMSDEKGRPCIADLVKLDGIRVYPVGRLDMYSEGLLILTDDGELANRLAHPSGDKAKKYLLMLAGDIGESEIAALTAPMELDGYQLKPIEARLLKHGVKVSSQNKVVSVVAVTLHEGRNRQIRRMCENVGLKVIRLKRVAVGQIKLDDMKPGEWRNLTEDEVSKLKN